MAAGAGAVLRHEQVGGGCPLPQQQTANHRSSSPSCQLPGAAESFLSCAGCLALLQLLMLGPGRTCASTSLCTRALSEVLGGVRQTGTDLASQCGS